MAEPIHVVPFIRVGSLFPNQLRLTLSLILINFSNENLIVPIAMNSQESLMRLRLLLITCYLSLNLILLLGKPAASCKVH